MASGQALPLDVYCTLVIAYHNVAVEREFLEQWDQAAMAHKQGHEIAEKCLGPAHPLTQTMLSNCNAVLSKAAKKGKTTGPPAVATRGLDAAF